MLKLRNPHSILATLAKRPKDVVRLTLPKEAQGYWRQVGEQARKGSVPVASGAIAEAEIREAKPLAIEELLPRAAEGASPGVWLALDQLQDPQNVGAIFRNAAFFGARGVILTADRSAGLTSTVYDVASGGVDSVPFSVEVNMRRVMEMAKERGLWTLGTSETAKESFRAFTLDRSWLLVMGNEEKGMRRLVEETCDCTCAVPPAPNSPVGSLNVSVAAGVLLAQLLRSG